MPVSEHQRHQVFQWFEEAMGSEKASVMMDLLPPVGWGDIATNADLGALRSELRGEMHDLRFQLRGEMHELRSELCEGMSSLRVEIADSRAHTIRTVVLSVVASNAALVGLLFAAIQL